MSTPAATTTDPPDARRAIEAAVARAEVRPGEVVALQGANERTWVHAYCALRQAGAIPLLVDVGAPDAEVRRWLQRAGGGRLAGVAVDGTVAFTGVRTASPTRAPGSVLIPTSGSTGAPTLVERADDSLRREGRRHATWSGLTPADRVLAPIPVWHAYALGWLHAALEVGCGFDPVPPDSPVRCTRAVNEGATVLVLTPATLRLLLARRGRDLDRDHRLRLVMVGAGSVTDQHDRAFGDIFGLGLARNYGSTQTGALFSAPPGAPGGCVGAPMDGVMHRLRPAVDDTSEPSAPLGISGRLEVALDGGDWLDTGDLAREGPHGLVITGRSTRAVRRGDRWVSLEEIEEVLRSSPDVVDVTVSATPTGVRGAEVVRADVVLAGGPTASTTAVRDLCSRLLSRHKVPDEFRAVPVLHRSPAGKTAAPQVVGLGPAATLVDAAQAHKLSSLLFALVDTGLFAAAREGPATAEALAVRCGLDLDVTEDLVAGAVTAGLLEVPGAPGVTGPVPPVGAQRGGDRTADPGPAPDEAHVDALIAWERQLADTWITPDELVRVARHGMQQRRFDQELPSSRMRELYGAAMHPAAAYRRTRFALNLLRARPGDRMLEITCGPGRYARGGVAEATMVRVGALAPSHDDVLARAADREVTEPYDVVVVCNAVHLPGPGSDLAGLLDLVAPGGRLLVDDVFVDGPDPTDYRLDWLTHGGRAWPTAAGLGEGLRHVGFDVLRTVRVGRPAGTLVIATPAVGRRAGATA